MATIDPPNGKAAIREATVFGDTECEIYDAGAIRLRLLVQSPDQPIRVTDSTMPPRFPGPVKHRHAGMADAFYVLEGS